MISGEAISNAALDAFEEIVNEIVFEAKEAAEGMPNVIGEVTSQRQGLMSLFTIIFRGGNVLNEHESLDGENPKFLERLLLNRKDEICSRVINAVYDTIHKGGGL